MSIIALAAESHEEVNTTLNWAVGAGILAFLLLVLGLLLAFGGGREHS